MSARCALQENKKVRRKRYITTCDELGSVDKKDSCVDLSNQTATQRKWLRFGKEPRQNARAVTFVKKSPRTICRPRRRGASVLIAFTLMNSNKTKLKPNEVGSILKGGAAERARSDF